MAVGRRREEPPEHRTARLRTEGEDRGLEARALAEALPPPTREQHDAAIAEIRERTLRQKAARNRGQGDLVDEGRGQWSES